MKKEKVCVMAEIEAPQEIALLEKYAAQGCRLAIMSRNRRLGKNLKKVIEKEYGVPVFFFHGDATREDDQDIFMCTIEGVYGGIDYLICHSF